MASQGKRNRQREKRKAAKAARKAARQAIWEALKGTGKNKKRKSNKGQETGSRAARIEIDVKVVRFNRDGTKTVSVQKRRVHGGAECPNIGCKRCSPLWKI
jgi:hypothetical protein